MPIPLSGSGYECPECKRLLVYYGLGFGMKDFKCSQCAKEWDKSELGVQHEDVRVLVDSFKEVWPGADFGPAHIVLRDYNFGDGNINFCLDLCEGLRGNKCSPKSLDMLLKNRYEDKHSRAEIEATYYFLKSLLVIPEDKRELKDE